MKNTCTVALVLFSLLTSLSGQRAGTTADQQVLGKLLQQYDKDQNGRVERREYPRTADAFANLDRDNNGVIDAADFEVRAARGPRRGAEPAGGDAKPTTKLPKVGDMAPDFELPMLGVKDQTIKLSSFRGKQPVALVFGSYT